MKERAIRWKMPSTIIFHDTTDHFSAIWEQDSERQSSMHSKHQKGSCCHCIRTKSSATTLTLKQLPADGSCPGGAGARAASQERKQSKRCSTRGGNQQHRQPRLPHSAGHLAEVRHKTVHWGKLFFSVRVMTF